MKCAWSKKNESLSNFEGTEVQEEATTTEFLMQIQFMGVHMREEPKRTGGPIWLLFWFCGVQIWHDRT